MNHLYKFVILALLLAVAGCAVPVKEGQDDTASEKHAALLDVLPRHIQGFTYEGVREYPDPWGYSLRYRSDSSRRTYADIYIYPVPGNATNLSQKKVVTDMTNEALWEIKVAKEKGAYSDYKIIHSAAFEIDGNFTSRVDLQLVSNNLVLYSLLYVTERNGKLIKARISMPDNDANRGNKLWQEFVEQTFQVIIQNILKA